MDNDLAKNRFSDYFLTMANPEAPQLSNLAAKLADRHLKKDLSVILSLPSQLFW